MKDHDDPLEEVSFVPFFEDISVDYEPGIDAGSDDARRVEAVAEEARGGLRPDGQDQRRSSGCTRRARRGEFATGIIYIEPDRDDFLDTAERRGRAAGDAAARSRPSRARALEEIMEELRWSAQDIPTTDGSSDGAATPAVIIDG